MNTENQTFLTPQEQVQIQGGGDGDKPFTGTVYNPPPPEFIKKDEY